MLLPLPEKNQYLCAIKLVGTKKSVRACLGFGFIPQNWSFETSHQFGQNSEKTTVRIKAKDVPNFYAYAVPGLKNHVFVGSFTI